MTKEPAKRKAAKGGAAPAEKKPAKRKAAARGRPAGDRPGRHRGDRDGGARRSLRGARGARGRRQARRPRLRRRRRGARGADARRQARGHAGAPARRRLLRGAARAPRAPAAEVPREEPRRGVDRLGRLFLRSGARPDGRLLHPRRQPPQALRQDGRAPDPSRGRGRRAFRGLGAERQAGQRHRRLQRLGRPAPRHAPAHRHRHLGDLRARRGRRRGLQVRDHRRRRQPPAAEGRSLRARLGAAPEDRLGGRALARARLGATTSTGRSGPGPTRAAPRSRSTRCIRAPGSRPTTARS